MARQKYTEVQLSDLLTSNQYRTKAVDTLYPQEFVSKRRRGLVLLSAALSSFYLLTVLRTETGRKEAITWNIERKNCFLDFTLEAPK